MDFNPIFNKAKKDRNLNLEDLEALEQFVEDTSLDVDDFKNENDGYYKDLYLKELDPKQTQKKLLKRASQTYDAVQAIATEGTLEKRPIYKSANLFFETRRFECGKILSILTKREKV